MSRRETYETRAEELLLPIAEENGVEIYDVEYVKEAAAQGTQVLIANAEYSIREILAGGVKCTRIRIR